MFYILYQVTNNINGKIYVGVHKTKSLDDGYMGSGKVINSAIKKYGIENFTRVVLEQFENSTSMFAREKEVVTEEFLARDDTYNLRRGGYGGFDYINRNKLNDRTGMSHTAESNLKNSINRKAAVTDELRRLTSVRSLGNHYNPKLQLHGADHPASGEKSEQHIEKIATSISELHKQGKYDNSPIYQTGKDHPQFGSKWITNGVDSKKILKTDPVPEGWRAGRVMRA